MLRQTDVVDILRSDGYDISIRTLRYWRSVGLLPELYNRKYPECILDTIKELCYKYRRLIGDIVFVYKLEGDTFNVYRYIIEKPRELNGNFRLTLYTDKGIIIEWRRHIHELLR